MGSDLSELLAERINTDECGLEPSFAEWINNNTDAEPN